MRIDHQPDHLPPVFYSLIHFVWGGGLALCARFRWGWFSGSVGSFGDRRNGARLIDRKTWPIASHIGCERDVVIFGSFPNRRFFPRRLVSQLAISRPAVEPRGRTVSRVPKRPHSHANRRREVRVKGAASPNRQVSGNRYDYTISRPVALKLLYGRPIDNR